jgi:hypothetical protein
MLDSAGGASLYDIAERFGVSLRTAQRYLEALRAAGEPIFEKASARDSSERAQDLAPHASARRETLTLTTTRCCSLFLSRRVFDFLAGTGFKEDLDDVFARLEATLRKRDFVAARHLDRKIFDLNEAPPHLRGPSGTRERDPHRALLREERLEITRHAGIGTTARRANGSARLAPPAALFDPYRCSSTRRASILAGFSHAHGQVRTWPSTASATSSGRRGEGFPYPADFHPPISAEGAFGSSRVPPATCACSSPRRVARYVTRRQWHPSQKVKKVRAGSS